MVALVITDFFRGTIADDYLEISRCLPKDADDKHARACAESGFIAVPPWRRLHAGSIFRVISQAVDGSPSARRMSLIGELLSPNDILLGVDAPDKERVFEAVARLLHGRCGFAQSQLVDSLIAREECGSTGIGHGVAIPHARIKGLARPFARLRPDPPPDLLRCSGRQTGLRFDRDFRTRTSGPAAFATAGRSRGDLRRCAPPASAPRGG